MPSPLSPLSSSSTFCLELPELPPAGVKPLPIDTRARAKSTLWHESSEPGRHLVNSIMPAALNMDDAFLRVTPTSDPTKPPKQDVLYGPMRIKSCSPAALGGDFTFIEEGCADVQVGHVPDDVLRAELTVPTSDGEMMAVVSRVPPRIKASYAAAKAGAAITQL